jgi:hypothetical protein
MFSGYILGLKEFDIKAIENFNFYRYDFIYKLPGWYSRIVDSIVHQFKT